MKTVLLIEDNADIRDNLTEYLELKGYNILTATNGHRGVELARQFIPDIILCDILMPEMDGFEVLHSLLGTAGTLNIPFVFSSCRSEKSDRTEALNMGADDYITKPYELEELVHKIEGLLCTGSVRHH